MRRVTIEHFRDLAQARFPKMRAQRIEKLIRSTAGLFGAVPAVLIGGVGTIAVALLWMRLFPGLRATKSLGG